MAVERLLPLAAFAPASFWFIRLASEGRLTRRTFSDLGILILALMLPVTLWATAIPEKTIPQVYRLLSGILLYYAAVNWAVNRRRLRLLLNGVLASGLLLALFAPLAVVGQETKLPLIPESVSDPLAALFSGAINANVLAAVLGLFLPLSAGMILFGWSRLQWGERWLALLTLMAGTAALIFTESRSGLLAFAAALGLLAMLRGRWGWITLAALAAGIGYAVFRLGPEQLLSYIFFDLTLQGMDGRVEIWSRAYYMLQDFPFTGVGMGSFGEVADKLYPFFLFSPGKIYHAHNLFLQVGVDLGLFGLIGWLAALMGILWAAARALIAGKLGHDGWITGLGAGLLASQMAMLVHGLFDAAVWGMVKPAPLLWLVWSLAAAAWLVVRQEEIWKVNSTIT